ncbi:MAG: amino acid ABC transporter permease [Candidatus Protistobacter heckmanni]|nr:amino acid ABC transporter permease [Candidatus Protistobacter heckmanni]
MNYSLNWGVFFAKASTNETYLDWLIAGFKVTVALGLCSCVIALALGTVFGVCRSVPSKTANAIGAAYVELFRNVPLLVQLFIWYFVVPELLPDSVGDAIKNSNPVVQQFLAAVFCLGTFTAARVAEQVRSGLNSLPSGQRNAGLTMGFTLTQTYRFVLLPVAFRVIVPPLTSETLNVFKNSAVASTIGLLELAAQGRQLVDYMAATYESFIAVTLAYMLINVAIMRLMGWVEKRTRLPGFIGSK